MDSFRSIFFVDPFDETSILSWFFNEICPFIVIFLQWNLPFYCNFVTTLAVFSRVFYNICRFSFVIFEEISHFLNEICHFFHNSLIRFRFPWDVYDRGFLTCVTPPIFCITYRLYHFCSISVYICLYIHLYVCITLAPG